MIIHNKFLRQHVNDLTIHGQGYDPCGIDHLLDFPCGDFLVFHRNDAGTVDAGDMPAGNTYIDGPHLNSGHELGIINGLANGLNGAVDIHHHALLEATGRMDTNPKYVDDPIAFNVANNGADLRGPDVKSNYNMMSSTSHSAPSSRISC